MQACFHPIQNPVAPLRNSALRLGRIFITLLMSLLILAKVEASDGRDGRGYVVVMTADEQPFDDISPEQREEMERRIDRYERNKGPGMTKAISDPPTLQPYAFFPQAGTLWQDLYVNNFVDIDSGSGLLDWDCTQQTYNGHTGHDSDIRSFREQAIGVPVFAALDGTVVDLHDGEPDMNTSAQGQPANYVILDHGNTHYTWYWHLKNGSVAVAINQVVKAGTQLGLTGSSGNSTAPHLHFESRYNGTYFEPSSGSCRTGTSNWVQQVPVRRDMYVRDFGFSTTALSGNLLFDNSTRTSTYLQGTSSEWFRTDMGNVPANSTYRIRYRRPNGVIAIDSAGSFNNSGAYRKASFYWNFAVNLNVAGTWRLLIDVNNQTVVDAPFQVVSSSSQIVNRAPNSITTSFDPAAPSTSDVVFCRVQTSLIFEDPDYDIIRYRYRWSVNSTVVRDVTTAALSDALRKGTTTAGDSVKCTVTPSDGALSGPVASSVVSISAPSTGNVLQNGVPVSGISGAQGSQKFWTINVPSGATNLQFQTSGGTGDADLFVRFGSAPTTSTYDCGPVSSDNNETCSFTSPAAGTWYVMIEGYAAYSGATLVGSYQTGQSGPTMLQNGVPVSGISGAQGSQKFWTINVPSGATNLQFQTSGGTGDADLFARFGSAPTTSSYDCGPVSSDNNETCSFPSPAAGTWYVMVEGYASYSGATLVGSFQTGSSCNSISDVEPNDSTAAPQVITGNCNQISGTFLNDPTTQENDYFRLSLPAGSTVTALLNIPTGNYDLEIYDAVGTRVAYSTISGASAGQLSWTNSGASAANIYIRVHRSSSTTPTTYQLRVSY